jgi:hypothetical protein
MPSRGFLAAALFWLLLCAAGAPAGEVIERILAVVDGEPILQSEVELLARVLGRSLPEALEARIDESLMYREAVRLGIASGDDQAAYQSLLERVPALALEPEIQSGLRQIARRQAVILHHVEMRLRPLIRVSAEGLQQAYQHQYPGPERPPLESVEGALRERLTDEQLNQRIEEWVAELRSGAEILHNP